MTWVKIDDGFHDHPKIEALSSDAYRAFIGGLCYCARFLTDGHIPPARVKQLGRTAAVRELEQVGLWDRNGDGVHVHDYLEYQPSSAAILAKRAAESARKRRGREADS